MPSSKIPYLAGGFVGLLLTFSVAQWNDYFAPVHVFSNIGSSIIHLFDHEHTNNTLVGGQTLHAHIPNEFLNFETFFLIGIVLGAFVSAMFCGKFKLSTEVPPLFHSRFGNRKKLRFFLAFWGGLVMSIGGMMAGGCSIAYGISAVARFDASGIITFSAFYFGGVMVNWLIYRRTP